MSIAIDAVVLIRLCARRGEVVAVRELADYMRVSDLVVEESLMRLERGGGLSVIRLAGIPFSAVALPESERVASS